MISFFNTEMRTQSKIPPTPLTKGGKTDSRKTIFWIVGEKSADQHSAKVIEALNQSLPTLQHIGIGGPLMQKQGLLPLFPFEKFLIIGFFEVLKHLPFIMKVEKSIKKYFETNKPDLVILCDYPGLNLRIAKIAHRLGLKVFYFICPQFWAWKKHRVLQLKNYCVHLACILPFEKEILDEFEIPATYVGHPVIEEIEYKLDKNSFAEKFHLDVNKKWIGFFPGSRDGECKKLLPIYLNTINAFPTVRENFQFLISKANSVSNELFDKCETDSGQTYLIDGYNFEMMKYCDFLIVKSGTSTIETAFVGTPFIIVYKVNYLSYILARMMIKVKFIGMPNIIFDRLVIPELLQNDVNPENIINKILFYMDDELEYQKMLKDFKDLENILGKNIASKATSELIKKIIM